MLHIRFATVNDVQKIIEIFEYYVINSHYTMRTHSLDESDLREKIAEQGDRYPFLVLCDNDDVVGYIDARPFGDKSAYAWNVELSSYLQKDYTHRGAGPIITHTILELLKGLGFQNVYVGIVLPKACGQKYFERMGFSTIGTMHKRGYKFNRWYDIVQMELSIGDHSEDVEPLKKISELDPDFVSRLFDSANEQLKQLENKGE